MRCLVMPLQAICTFPLLQQHDLIGIGQAFEIFVVEAALFLMAQLYHISHEIEGLIFGFRRQVECRLNRDHDLEGSIINALSGVLQAKSVLLTGLHYTEFKLKIS